MSRTSQRVLIVAMTASVGMVVIANVVFEPTVAIRAGYVVLGSVLGLVLNGMRGDNPTMGIQISPVVAFKIHVSLVCLGFAGAVLAQSLTVLLFTMPILGVTFVVLWNVTESRPMLYSGGLVLFSLVPFSWFLTSGFIFAHGDTAVHIRNIEILVQSGSIQSMPLEQYRVFSLEHIFIATQSLSSNITPYTGIIITGVTAMLLTAVATSRICFAIFGRKDFEIATFIAIIGMSTFSFYATYLFPQAFTLPLLFLLVLLAVRTRQEKNWQIISVALVLSVSSAYSHHLSLVIFLLLIVQWLVTNTILDQFVPQRKFQTTLLVLPVLTAVTVWVFVYQNFVINLAIATRTVITESIGRPVTTGAEITRLGISAPPVSMNDAAMWLISLEGIYLSLFVAFLLLGVSQCIEQREQVVHVIGLVVVAGTGAFLLLKIPITFQAKSRMSLMWAPFTGILVGMGIARIKPESGIQRITKQSPITIAVAALLISAPLIEPFDVHESGYSPVKSYSDGEVKQLAALAEFMEGRETVSATHTDAVMLRRFGAISDETLSVSGTAVTSPHLMVYRRGMPENQLYYSTGAKFVLKPLVVADHWMRKEIERSSSVYSSGQMWLVKTNST